MYVYMRDVHVCIRTVYVYMRIYMSTCRSIDMYTSIDILVYDVDSSFFAHSILFACIHACIHVCMDGCMVPVPMQVAFQLIWLRGTKPTVALGSSFQDLFGSFTDTIRVL